MWGSVWSELLLDMNGIRWLLKIISEKRHLSTNFAICNEHLEGALEFKGVVLDFVFFNPITSFHPKF